MARRFFPQLILKLIVSIQNILGHLWHNLFIDYQKNTSNQRKKRNVLIKRRRIRLLIDNFSTWSHLIIECILINSHMKEKKVLELGKIYIDQILIKNMIGIMMPIFNLTKVGDLIWVVSELPASLQQELSLKDFMLILFEVNIFHQKGSLFSTKMMKFLRQ